jgi:hypothetical protein
MLTPDVADGADFEIGLLAKAKNFAEKVAVAATEHADANAVVSAQDAGDAERGESRAGDEMSAGHGKSIAATKPEHGPATAKLCSVVCQRAARERRFMEATSVPSRQPVK